MSKVSSFFSKYGHDCKLNLLHNFGYSYFLEKFKKSELEKMYDLSKKNKASDLSELIAELFFLSSDNDKVSIDFLEVSKTSNLYKDCEGRYKKKIREIQKRRIDENPYNEEVEKTIIEINDLEQKLVKARNNLLLIPVEKITCPHAKQMYVEFLQRGMENE